MAAGNTLRIEILQASAAAIVSTANLPDSIAALVDTTLKLVVHPHLATVATDDRLLLGYLRKIYAGRRPLSTGYPSAATFAEMALEASVVVATGALATGLAVSMSKRNAKAGILFGFIIRLEDGVAAHGVIKADLDDEQRFHFLVGQDGGWSLGEVSDILPPPRTDFAKFAIAPQPNGTAPCGIKDSTHNEAAAEYFLEAVGLSVPKTSGTQAAVARAALKAGYTHREIQAAVETLTEPTPITDFVHDQFPRVPDRQAERLGGSPVRPMTEVRNDDPYIRVYKTANPHFELSVDSAVDVSIEGRVVTVTLPVGSDPVREDARE